MLRAVVGPHPRATFIRAATLVVAAAIIFGFVLKPVRLEGISMLPTYKDGDFDFANRLAYLWREPARGDVVAIRMAGPERPLRQAHRRPAARDHRDRGGRGARSTAQPLVEPAVELRAPWTMPARDPRRARVFRDRRQPIDGDARTTTSVGRSRDRIVGKMLF